jgi:hypothetical protein
VKERLRREKEILKSGIGKERFVEGSLNGSLEIIC